VNEDEEIKDKDESYGKEI